jgi:signal transduction histidine kinase
MARVLLLLAHTENRRLLAEVLAPHHDVLETQSADALNRPFDLGVVDGRTLDREREWIQARRDAEAPVMLPFLLVTSRQDVDITTRELWQSVDDLLVVPVEKAVLDARVALLLRARTFSVELARRNDDLQAMVHALNHDLRAPARISASFAQALLEDYGDRLDDRGRHYIARIRAAGARSRKLLDRLLAFAQLGREALHVQDVALEALVRIVLDDLEEAIATRDAVIDVRSPLPVVQADFGLLELALTNLIANALKYVAEGERPHVTLRAAERPRGWRIEVEDRGIGIAPEDQARIFHPFVRLHGEETYRGSGLGLAIAQKAVTLMEGRIGVQSSPGTGSTFWIEWDR